MTAPKLTRIPWPKGPHATTRAWLQSMQPTPPPPTEADVEQRKAAKADRRLHPPRAGNGMTSVPRPQPSAFIGTS